jgi:hypothetical protein
MCTDAYCIDRLIDGAFEGGSCSECDSNYATYFWNDIYLDSATCEAVHCNRCDENT